MGPLGCGGNSGGWGVFQIFLTQHQMKEELPTTVPTVSGWANQTVGLESWALGQDPEWWTLRASVNFLIGENR